MKWTIDHAGEMKDYVETTHPEPEFRHSACQRHMLFGFLFVWSRVVVVGCVRVFACVCVLSPPPAHSQSAFEPWALVADCMCVCLCLCVCYVQLSGTPTGSTPPCSHLRTLKA
jgi:hypothetical protein